MALDRYPRVHVRCESWIDRYEAQVGYEAVPVMVMPEIHRRRGSARFCRVRFRMQEGESVVVDGQFSCFAHMSSFPRFTLVELR